MCNKEWETEIHGWVWRCDDTSKGMGGVWGLGFQRLSNILSTETGSRLTMVGEWSIALPPAAASMASSMVGDGYASTSCSHFFSFPPILPLLTLPLLTLLPLLLLPSHSSLLPFLSLLALLALLALLPIALLPLPFSLSPSPSPSPFLSLPSSSLILCVFGIKSLHSKHRLSG